LTSGKSSSISFRLFHKENLPMFTEVMVCATDAVSETQVVSGNCPASFQFLYCKLLTQCCREIQGITDSTPNRRRSDW
jgi:hypothetical protein